MILTIGGAIRRRALARSSLFNRAVKRSMWIVFVALVLLATLALFRPGSTGDVVASNQTSPPPLAPVTVRHEFVTVPVSAPNTPFTRTARRPDPPARPTRAAMTRPGVEPTGRPEVRPAARGGSFFGRARRAVVGDGRYRPQPFPRVKDDN